MKKLKRRKGKSQRQSKGKNSLRGRKKKGKEVNRCVRGGYTKYPASFLGRKNEETSRDRAARRVRDLNEGRKTASSKTLKSRTGSLVS